MFEKLYVGNLPFEIDDRDLRELFESVGVEVRDAHIHYDGISGRSRGFGTVRCRRADAAVALALGETEFRGRKLLIRPWTESARFTQPRYGKKV